MHLAGGRVHQGGLTLQLQALGLDATQRLGAGFEQLQQLLDLGVFLGNARPELGDPLLVGFAQVTQIVVA